MQTSWSFSITIRDSGDPSPFDQINQTAIDALSIRNKLSVFRHIGEDSPMLARYELFNASKSDYLIWLDTDIVLEPNAMEIIENHYAKPNCAPILCGVKKEVYPSRVYHNEINEGGSGLNGKSREEIKKLKPKFVTFPDMAICVVPRSIMKDIDWKNTLQSFNKPNLAGEDCAIMLQVLDTIRNPYKSALLDYKLIGEHLSRPEFRWRWEPSTDSYVKKFLTGKIDQALIDSVYR
jgi:hypothetical protein